MYDVIVIGAGAAGMSAAIAAARAGADVMILEKMKKPGRKLLLTGNGRCNLTNLDPALSGAYHSGAGEEQLRQVMEHALRALSPDDLCRSLTKAGLPVLEKNGYVYPVSQQASSVLALLERTLRNLRVKVRCDTPVREVRRAEDGTWQAVTDGWTYQAERLIIACGGMSYPQTGSDGSGYKIADAAGHTIVPVMPALTALTCGRKEAGELAGLRCAVKLTLHITKNDGTAQDLKQEECLTESGELQMTETEISGIVVFQLSRFAAYALADGKKVQAEIDFIPQMEEEKLTDLLMHLRDHAGEAETPSGVFGLLHHEKLMRRVLDTCGLSKRRTAADVSDDEIRSVSRTLKHMFLNVTGCRDISLAQVTAGGVSLREIIPATLESSVSPGLYFAGEMLDVDGPCGGYNLQWAFSSGYLAGSSAAAFHTEERTDGNDPNHTA